MLRDVEEEGWTKSAPGVGEVPVSILWELRCSRGKRWWWGTPPGIVFFFFCHTMQLVGSQFPNQGLNLVHGSESLQSYPLGC